MESLDTGKRLVESEIDIDDVTSVFHHFGLVADAEAGRVVDTGRDDVVSRVVHEPVGVCGLITPWNYPLLQVSWKVAPALAAGCTFVLKPSELSPHTAIHLMKLLAEAGVPAGVAQPGGRRRTERRCPAERGPEGGPGLLHRWPRDRQADHGRRIGHGEEDRARARWQEPQHRLRGRGPRECARHGTDRGVPALRSGLLRRRQADRRGVDPRLVRRGAGRPGRGHPSRRPLRREGADRGADLARPPGQGDGVRRSRRGRGRQGPARWSPGHRGRAGRRLLLRADDPRRRALGHVRGPGRVVRTGAHRGELHRRRRRGPDRQRLDLRTGRRGLDPGCGPGTAHRGTAADGHGVDQRLPPVRRPGRVGRLQAVRHRSRAGTGRPRRVPRDQAHLAQHRAGTAGLVRSRDRGTDEQSLVATAGTTSSSGAVRRGARWPTG